MALETADKRKFETFLPAATVLGSFRFVRLAPHFGQDDREGAGSVAEEIPRRRRFSERQE
ncbi:MAG: hypothetical protein DMG83_00575 [Acidobacteria bacterium]|nr:MAG: hypothetical protein DMG83_00575 [Acidobacteriota bacterium]